MMPHKTASYLKRGLKTVGVSSEQNQLFGTVVWEVVELKLS